MDSNHLERFDKALAAWEGFVGLGRGVVAFFAAIFAGHILGTEVSGGNVYWPAIVWNALLLAVLVFPILTICLFLLIFTEVSKAKILYVTLVSTTLVSALEAANSERQALLLVGLWLLGFTLAAAGFRKLSDNA